MLVMSVLGQGSTDKHNRPLLDPLTVHKICLHVISSKSDPNIRPNQITPKPTRIHVEFNHLNCRHPTQPTPCDFILSHSIQTSEAMRKYSPVQFWHDALSDFRLSRSDTLELKKIPVCWHRSVRMNVRSVHVQNTSVQTSTWPEWWPFWLARLQGIQCVNKRPNIKESAAPYSRHCAHNIQIWSLC